MDNVQENMYIIRRAFRPDVGRPAPVSGVTGLSLCSREFGHKCVNFRIADLDAALAQQVGDAGP